VLQRWWSLLRAELARVRRGGRASMSWSLRVTAAATASYLAGLLFFPSTRPLLAPLTAMLVVQVTPLSLLNSGRERVIAVIAGVGLAVGFSSVVPLSWWSLGLLIWIAITVGQYLRLRDNLIEVAISAMLVLGVGSLGATAFAWQRIAETLVGAAVGILVNLVYPPKAGSADAAVAIDGLADKVSGLLVRAGDELDELAGQDDRSLLAAQARGWLLDARRITDEIPAISASLRRAEEGRRLNVRSVGTSPVEPGLRQGLEALEHTSVSVRSLMRTVGDAARDGLLTDRAEVLRELALTFRQMAAGVDAFGELVRNEGQVQNQLSAPDVERLRGAFDGLNESVVRLDARIAAEPGNLLELFTHTRMTVRRLLSEFDLGERVRRQFQLVKRRARRPRPRRRERPVVWEPAGPDDETQPISLPTDPDVRGPGTPGASGHA
jgi:hypothetical protein